MHFKGLNHDFLLVDDDFRRDDFELIMRTPGRIRLHDDLVTYIYDSLRWIPAVNVHQEKPCHGLCGHGQTAIRIEGAPVARQVFNSWADLFECGPETLELTGGYTWIEGESPETGYDQQLRFSRDEVVHSFRTLATYANEVDRSGGRLYLLHDGV